MKLTKLPTILFFVICITWATTAFSAGTSPTEVVQNGLKEYKEKGAKAAIKAWISGSPIEGNKEAISQSNMLEQIQEFFGSYMNYEILKTLQISERTHMVLFVINYTNGPLYAKFQTYKNEKDKYVITEFNFHTKVENIIPREVLFEK